MIRPGATAIRRSGLALVLGFQAAALVHAAWTDSVVVDEAGHIASGLVHWVEGDFRPYHVNPPLVRLLGTVPLLALGPTVPIAEPGTPGAERPELLLGRRFAELNSGRYVSLVRLARWAPIVLALGASLLVWDLGRRHGEAAGWIGLLLWASCPLALGHGHLLTADMGATTLGLLCLRCHLRERDEPTAANAARLGIAFGLALLAKFTSIVVIAVLVASRLHAVVRGGSARIRRPPVGRAAARRLAIAGSVAWLTLQTGYAWTAPVLRVVPRVDQPRRDRIGPAARARLWLPLPREFVLGAERQRQDFAGGMRSYLDGQLRDRGWWSYYLRAAAYKLPVGHLALVGAAAVLALAGPGGRAARLAWALGLTLFAAVSSQVGFSHHLRYILPALPFLYVAAGAALAPVAARSRMARALVVVSLAASVLSVARSHPHHIAYFNEPSGGWRGGHRHLLDSNLDWGQDLLRLRRWQADRPRGGPAPPFLVAYHIVDPDVFGIAYRYPADPLADPPEPGTYILSVNALMGYEFVASDGTGGLTTYPRGAFAAFRRLRPAARIGHSLWLFEVPAAAPAPTRSTRAAAARPGPAGQGKLNVSRSIWRASGLSPPRRRLGWKMLFGSSWETEPSRASFR